MYNIHIHTQTNNLCERVIIWRTLLQIWWLWKEPGMKEKRRSYKQAQKAWTREKKQPSQRGLRSAFHSFSLSGLLLTPRSFKADWNLSWLEHCCLSREIDWNVNPRASSFFAWVDVRLGFPTALIKWEALVYSLFCWTQSFVCSWGERNGRDSKSPHRDGWRRTASKAKTSGNALCAPVLLPNIVKNNNL